MIHQNANSLNTDVWDTLAQNPNVYMYTATVLL